VSSTIIKKAAPVAATGIHPAKNVAEDRPDAGSVSCFAVGDRITVAINF
jgi:hypothetical protein